jgi:hypothetical protein
MAGVSDGSGFDDGTEGWRADHLVDPDDDGSPRPPTRVPGVWKQIPTGIKVLLVALVLVAAGGIVALTQLSSDSSSGLAGGVIEQLIPARNAKIVQQDAVGIDLQTGYSADLAVNGVPVPEDQLIRQSGLDTVLFRPGPGQIVEEWPAGQNCVVATFWATDVGRQDAKSESWCFTAF